MTRPNPHTIAGFAVAALVPWLNMPNWVDSEVFPRWLWVYSVAFLAGLVLLVRRPITSWSHTMRSRLLVALAGISVVAMTWFSTAKHYPGLLAGQILDWSAFALLAYFVASLPRPNRSHLLNGLAYGAAGAGAAISFWQVFTWAGPGAAFELGFFGFQNHWAEFLGFGLVGMFAIRDRSRFASLLIAPLIFGLALTHCRSVQLAVLAGAIALSVTQLRARRPFWVTVSLLVFSLLPFGISKVLRTAESRISIATVVAFAHATPTQPSRGFDLETVKAGNTELRLNRWVNSLALVKENPWLGHGLGGFEFAYRKLGPAADPETTPQNVVRSPHNAYLELAVEIGIPIALLVLSLIATMLRSFAVRHFVQTFSPLPLGLLIYWMTDAVFAFPLELPFPFLTAAGLLGVFAGEFDHVPHPGVSHRTWGFRRLGSFATIAGLLGLVGAGALFSYQANQALFVPDVAACERFPSVWRSCLRSVDHLAAQGNWDAAWNLALANEKRFPGVDFFQWQKGALYQSAVMRALYFGLPVR